MNLNRKNTEQGYKNLDRIHRARLVGQYHARKGFGDLRAYGDWYNQLNAEERAFIHMYRGLAHDGALDPSDLHHLTLGERVKIKFEMHPNTIKALNDAFSLAAAALARSSVPVFQGIVQNLPKSLADGYVEKPGQGHYVGVSKRTKGAKK